MKIVVVGVLAPVWSYDTTWELTKMEEAPQQAQAVIDMSDLEAMQKYIIKTFENGQVLSQQLPQMWKNGKFQSKQQFRGIVHKEIQKLKTTTAILEGWDFTNSFGDFKKAVKHAVHRAWSDNEEQYWKEHYAYGHKEWEWEKQAVNSFIEEDLEELESVCEFYQIANQIKREYPRKWRNNFARQRSLNEIQKSMEVPGYFEEDGKLVHIVKGKKEVVDDEWAKKSLLEQLQYLLIQKMSDKFPNLRRDVVAEVVQFNLAFADL